MAEAPLHLKVRIPKGINISEPDSNGSAIRPYTYTNTDTQSSWCYLFIHNNKVNAFIDRVKRDNIRHFIHKTIVYQRNKHTRGILSVEKPTVSGLVFLQGETGILQYYLDVNYPGYHLVNNCSTHLPAVIPDSVMQPFMRVMEASPEQVRFLLHPFKYYAGGNIKLRLTSGFFAGIEGYVIRIDRDRRLVMDVGGMSVAISGIHCEKFEVVEEEAEKYRKAKQGISTTEVEERNLTELQERIDKDLYTPTTQQEVGLITEALERWMERALLHLEKWNVAEAKEILFFLLEEIDLYPPPRKNPSSKLDLSPILSVAHQVTRHIDAMTTDPRLSEETRQEISAERDALLPLYGYLFG